MKKLFVALLMLSMLLTMTGCCLKHDMAPATCTEPATCTKCGKTEGSPLGHTEELMEDVAPSCTEPGSKGGVKCSVCGEILSAPEVVEATGHDWAEATYFKPQTCRICGMEEGEALGNKLFEKALFISSDKMNEQLDDNTETDLKAASTAAEKTDIRKTINISAASEGLGEDTDAILSSLALNIQYDNNFDEKFVLNADLSLLNSELLTVIAAVEKDGLNLSVPSAGDTVYVLSDDLLSDIVSALMPFFDDEAEVGDDVSSFSDKILANPIYSEKNLELVNKYLSILVSAANETNVTEKEENYTLSAIGEAPLCNIVSVCPTKDEWEVMLTELFTTAQHDEELKDFLVTLFTGNYKSGLYLESEDEFVTKMLDDFYADIDGALVEVDETAENLSQYTLRFAYADERAYAVKVLNDDGGIGFESFGKADEGGRRDVIAVYNQDEAVILAENTLTISDEFLKDEAALYGTTDGNVISVKSEFVASDPDDNRLPEFKVDVDFGTGSLVITNDHAEESSGSLKFDLKTETGNIALNVNSVAGAENIKLPSGEKKLVSSLDELMEAVGEVFSNIQYSPVPEN